MSMHTVWILAAAALFSLAFYFREPLQKYVTRFKKPKGPTPVSVNYHFTRFCNFSCGFCFHVSKNTYVAPKEDTKRALGLLQKAGMRKINFAGGEPFLYPRFLGTMLKYCKQHLKMESVSVVTNGSMVTKKFLTEHAPYLDILAVSCDSFDETINTEIGRAEKGKSAASLEQLFRISEWCRELGINFKLNTVVNALNWRENMAPIVEQLDPFRWKVFQVLLVESENDSLAKHKGDFDKFYLIDEDFENFGKRHEHLKCFVPEFNKLMSSFYLILDEYLCFLDKGDGLEGRSDSVLKVGVAKVPEQVRWDEESFHARGGIYDWSTKKSGSGDGCGGGATNKDLEW